MRQPNLPAFEPPKLPDVQPGDIFALGRHKIMCGDATRKEDVARLFAGRMPTLVVTSPPYAKQRDYGQPIECWDEMMQQAFCAQPFSEDAQVLVNLGPVHKKGEWVEYWACWVAMMRKDHWKLAGQYIWVKGKPSFGENQGRCHSSHEYVFHFRKKTIKLNNTVKNKRAGEEVNCPNPVSPKGVRRRIKSVVKTHRPPCSVFNISPEMANKTGHPAVFPVAFPQALIAAWKKANCIVYDPFCGSGTTLIAAEQEDVDGLAMEIAPAYVKIALARWRRVRPDQPIERLN